MCVIRDSDGKVCLLKHKGRVKPWSLPGGLLRWPESPENGLNREIHEELGWRLAALPTLRASLVSENFPMIELIFEAKSSVSDADKSRWVLQKSEIEGVIWVSMEELSRLDGILERHRTAVMSILLS